MNNHEPIMKYSEFDNVDLGELNDEFSEELAKYRLFPNTANKESLYRSIYTAVFFFCKIIKRMNFKECRFVAKEVGLSMYERLINNPDFTINAATFYAKSIIESHFKSLMEEYNNINKINDEYILGLNDNFHTSHQVSIIDESGLEFEMYFDRYLDNLTILFDKLVRYKKYTEDYQNLKTDFLINVRNKTSDSSAVISVIMSDDLDYLEFLIKSSMDFMRKELQGIIESK